MSNEPPAELPEIARARLGDERAFAAVVEPHERALFRHCYRMLGSGPDAEDALQDTLVRAWRRLETFDGSGPFGGWLYRIATNTCLDLLRARKARSDPYGVGPPSDPALPPELSARNDPWVEPVADAQLGAASDPGDEIVRREEISLAFVAALQRLPPRQRACLLLHDVLGFSHAEVADALELTPNSVNSLLFRARQVARPSEDRQPPSMTDPRLEGLLARYVEAWRLGDITGFLALVSDDVRLSMPPLEVWFGGRADVAAFIEGAIFSAARPHGVPLLGGWCNGQPAFATYEPDREGGVVASGLQVVGLDERGGALVITEIVSYRDAALPERCEFPGAIELPGGDAGLP
jgi:RNA polymerase sigma-70 factor (ECF subfamily)